MLSGAPTACSPVTTCSRLCLPADKERGSSEEKVDAGARSKPAGLSTSPAQHQSPGLTSDSAPVGARQPQTSGTGQGGQRKRTASGELDSRPQSSGCVTPVGSGCEQLLRALWGLPQRTASAGLDSREGMFQSCDSYRYRL